MDKLDKYVLDSCQNMHGKYAIVTGATGSIGFEVARFLTLLGADVGITYRNEEKGIQVKKKIENEFDRTIDIYPLDLCDLNQVKQFSSLINRDVDYLFNIAGTYHLPKKLIDDKYEITFLSDYLSVSILNRTFLEKYANISIINTGSVSMYYSKVDFDDIMGLNIKNKTVRYGRDKRLLALDTLNLKEKYPNNRIVLCHPGVSATSLFASSKGGFNKAFNALIFPLMKVIFMSPKKASLSILMSAFINLHESELVAPRGLFHSWGLPKNIKYRKSLFNSSEKKKLSEIYDQLL